MARLFSALILMFFAAISAVQAHDYAKSGIMISHPWARAATAGMANSAAYMMIENAGLSDDRLIRAESDIAKRVEIHETSMADNVMQMREVTGGLAIPENSKVELKPKGLHIMLMGLNGALKVGEKHSLTLIFEKAGPIEVELKIEPISKTGHDHSNMKMGQDSH